LICASISCKLVKLLKNSRFYQESVVSFLKYKIKQTQHPLRQNCGRTFFYPYITRRKGDFFADYRASKFNPKYTY